ncbi:MAG: antirestriction protein ArdA [Clostridia bacterium]|nr:antirestriction protein ArdA [Clostridia bacterium]
MSNVSIVIGSWGSYNACNNRALGSKWLDLGDYDSWEEIEEELIKEGFDLNGLDEELFIQDLDGIDDSSLNCDYMHPKRFFETLKESEVLNDDYKYEVLEAFLECRSYSEFEDLVDSRGSGWNDDIYMYVGYDWDDFGRERFDAYGYNLPDNLEYYIDFEEYGKQLSYYAQEYSKGIIEICI